MGTVERGTRVVLRDGSEVIVDQLHRTDAQRLAEGFARLSDETRRLRFLAPKPRLSAAELRYFTYIDHHDHEAIGAMVPADERGVGLARYIRDTDDPEVAEFAITVADDWQGRGLGTELLHRIIERAREEGIHRLAALVEADNDTMIHVLHGLGDAVRETGRGAGVVGYEVTLPTGDPPQLRELLRAVARRQCRSPRPVKDALADLVSHRPTGEGASGAPAAVEEQLKPHVINAQDHHLEQAERDRFTPVAGQSPT
ncbi:MAG: GNAT family N-acetyltransferase [Nocardioides sp.]|nr:GNAT family N-acetyltransferase [Nocardioides sp.]